MILSDNDYSTEYQILRDLKDLIKAVPLISVSSTSFTGLYVEKNTYIELKIQTLTQFTC